MKLHQPLEPPQATMRVNESRTKPTPVPECHLEPMVPKSGGAQEAAQELNTSKRKKNKIK